MLGLLVFCEIAGAVLLVSVKRGFAEPVVKWLIGLDLSAHEEGEDGIELCRELVVDWWVITGAIGISKIVQNSNDILWFEKIFWLLGVLLILGMFVRLLRMAAKGNPMKHYYNPQTISLGRWSATLTLAFSAFVVFAVQTQLFSFQHRPPVQFELGDVLPYRFAKNLENGDANVGLQLLVEVSPHSYHGGLPRELTMAVEVPENLRANWEVNGGTTAFAGTLATVRPLLVKEEELKNEEEGKSPGKLDRRRLERREDPDYPQYFVDDLNKLEMGNRRSENPVAKLDNPLVPQDTRRSPVVAIMFPELHPVNPVVLQIRLEPVGKDMANAWRDALPGVKSGKQIIVSELPPKTK